VIFPSEQDFALLLFQLFILLSLALALGEALRRFGHPTVIGEIFAGVLLGPSILGTLAPQISAALFHGPQNSASWKPRLVRECILVVGRRNGSQSGDSDSGTARSGVH
jgi:hypothetical protein